MPNVKVVFDGLFIGVPGLYHEALSLESPTLEKAIETLAAKHGDRFKEMVYDKATGAISPQVAVLVNGGRVAPDAELQESDELAFLIPIAGGADLTPTPSRYGKGHRVRSNTPFPKMGRGQVG